MGNYMEKTVIFEKLKEILVSEFQIAADEIDLGKRLDEDLELDSLDMVDIILYLKKYIGDKVDPGLFKGVRTVQDIVDLLEPIWK